ncbi:MAG: hypothetical protein RL385_2531, partial [Pseudomonadota bacterium]
MPACVARTSAPNLHVIPLVSGRQGPLEHIAHVKYRATLG